MAVHLTLLEAGLVVVVLLLLIDKLQWSKQKRRLNELEQKVLHQETRDRIMRSSIPELVERANKRWLDKSHAGKSSEQK